MIAPSAGMMLPYPATVQKRRFWMIADTQDLSEQPSTLGAAFLTAMGLRSCRI